MTNKLRTSILMVFAAYIAFIIGGLSLQGLVDDSPVAPLMRTNLPLLASWTLVEAGAVIALLAIVFGGLPLALSVIRRALTSSRRGLALLLVPGWALLALLLYGAFLASVAKGWISLPGVVRNISPGNFPLGNRLLIGGFILTFILGAAASTAAVWKVVSASDSPEQSFQLLGQRLSVKPLPPRLPSVCHRDPLHAPHADCHARLWLARRIIPSRLVPRQQRPPPDEYRPLLRDYPPHHGSPPPPLPPSPSSAPTPPGVPPK